MFEDNWNQGLTKMNFKMDSLIYKEIPFEIEENIKTIRLLWYDNQNYELSIIYKKDCLTKSDLTAFVFWLAGQAEVFFQKKIARFYNYDKETILYEIICEFQKDKITIEYNFDFIYIKQ